jgi:hypothetical protein
MNDINLNLEDLDPELKDKLSAYNPGQMGTITLDFVTTEVSETNFVASVKSVSDVTTPEGAGETEEAAVEEEELSEDLPAPALVVIGKKPSVGKEKV